MNDERLWMKDSGNENRSEASLSLVLLIYPYCVSSSVYATYDKEVMACASNFENRVLDTMQERSNLVTRVAASRASTVASA